MSVHLNLNGHFSFISSDCLYPSAELSMVLNWLIVKFVFLVL